MLTRSLAVPLALGALFVACSSGDSTPGPTGTRCGPSAPCTPPAYCDPARLVCVTPDTGVQPRTEAGIPIDGPYVPPTGDGPGSTTDGPTQPTPDADTTHNCKPDEQWCDGRCVNTRVHLQHCGACNNSCGPMSGSHARCKEGTCECYMPWINCDNDWASNGCECSTECDGTACKVWQCDPDSAGDCGTDQNKYCSFADRTCHDCTVGWMNCDNKGSACDCKITSYTCIGTECK